MAKVRILGPRALLPAVLPALQELGMLHVTPPKESAGVRLVHMAPADERRRRRLERIRGAVRAARDELGRSGAASRAGVEVGVPRVGVPRVGVPSAPTGAASLTGRPGPMASALLESGTLAAWARRARSVRREARALRARRSDLEEERALLERYRPFLASFQAMAEAASRWPNVAAYTLILPRGDQRLYERLHSGLTELLAADFEIWSRELETGERGVLVMIPRTADDRVEDLLAATRVEEVALPGLRDGLTADEAIARIVERLDAIPAELERVETCRAKLAERSDASLGEAEEALAAEIARIEIVDRAGATDRAFVLEGWLPATEQTLLRRELARTVGDTVVVEVLSREEWVGERVPVVLHNPRLFRPFETLVGILPLPRYGSIDPTPFLAVFFPMFFGLVLGDVGYGVVLGGIALVLARRSDPESKLRSFAQIAGACAAFTVVFGVLYGELFGDAGARALGLRALAFQREEALVPFLGFALALGAVHTLLGLTLNVVSKARQGGRAAVGPGVTLLMVGLVLMAFLAAVGVLPKAFFTPAVVLVLALFPVLIAVEGMLGATELLSTLGHILSYARVMAVGTASIMMAVAANRMIGAFGSVIVGSLFALLFHLVNFALGVFSPTIHALRLHFVEFFGTFYSPGGMRYEPFGRHARDPHT